MKRELLRFPEEGAGGGAGGAGGSAWTRPDGSAGSSDDTGGEQGHEDSEGAGAAAGGGAAAGAGTGGSGFTPNALWDELKGIDGFVMPANITKENEAELLKAALIQNKLAEADGGAQAGASGVAGAQQQQSPVIDDPDVIAYLNYKKINPDANLQTFMQQRNQYSDLLNLGDKDFMIEHYKREYGVYDEKTNPDGLKPEEINDLIGALESNKTLTLEARKLKKAYRAEAAKATTVTDADVQQAQTQRREAAITKIKADAQTLFAETNKITELNGVKLSKADITEINTAFEKAIIPDDKGEIPIFKMLQSDRILWNFFATNYLGDEKFKSALFNAGDATKEDLMKRLGLKPLNTAGRQASTGKKNTITPALWSVPEQDK